VLLLGFSTLPSNGCHPHDLSSAGMAITDPTPTLPPYQLLPPLSEEEYQALRADIAEHGILVPVELDESGNVLDGHHRLRIVTEFGIKDYPRVVRSGMEESEKVDHVLSLNLARRHLSKSQRQDLAIDLRRRGRSLRAIAGHLGVGPETVRRDLSTVPNETVTLLPSRITGRDGRAQPALRRPSITVHSRRDEARARAALTTLGPDAPPKPMPLRKAEQLGRETSMARLRSTDVPSVTTGCGWRLERSDFRDLDISDQSVDAIVTDPPYDFQGVPLWGDLGAWAVKVLRPGRLLVAYAGGVRLPTLIASLTEHLEWVRMGVVVWPQGQGSDMKHSMIRAGYRPVLICSAGSYQPRSWIHDVVQGDPHGAANPLHPWQQSPGPFRKWIEMVTKPGELVVDPCCGTATTGEAALAVGRRWIGCDSDPAAVSLARERMLAQVER